MGTNTLVDKVGGNIVTPSIVNDIHTALAGDLVGRNTDNVAESGKRLGTPTLPWGQIHVNTVFIEGSEFDPASIAVLPNQIKSGKVRTTSNQPAYLTPAGAAGGAECLLDVTPTPLVLDINNSEVSVESDLNFTLLDTAPSINNTSLVNDTDAVDQEETRIWGEHNILRERDFITMDAAGTEITDRIGEWHAFSINDGSVDEIFYAFIESATKLSRIYRGWFYNSSLAPVNRIKFANNDTITLLLANYLFVENNASTIDFTSNPPIWDETEPSGPADGDYWYDLDTNEWKRFNSGGGTFEVINRTWIGIAVTDDTDCLFARTREFQGNFKDDRDVRLEKESNTVIRSERSNSNLHVQGNSMLKPFTNWSWDITTDLGIAADMYDATEQANRIYWLYIKDTGDEVILDVHPQARFDLLGWYHPHNPWRCVGRVLNNGSSNFNDPFNFEPNQFENADLSFLSSVIQTGASQNVNGTPAKMSIAASTVFITGGDPIASIDAGAKTWKFSRLGFHSIHFTGSWQLVSGGAISVMTVDVINETLASSANGLRRFTENWSDTNRNSDSTVFIIEVIDLNHEYSWTVFLGGGVTVSVLNQHLQFVWLKDLD